MKPKYQFNLTKTQTKLFELIRGQPGEANIDQYKLSAELNVSRETISRCIVVLEKKGLIQKIKQPRYKYKAL